MEVHSSFFHGESSPTLKSYRIGQKVYVFLIKLSQKLFAGQSPLWLERLSAYVLNFVLGEVQNRGNGLVRGILYRLDGRPLSSEPDQQCGFTEIRHHIFIHFLVFHLITICIIAFSQLLLYDHSKLELFNAYWALASHDQSQGVLERPASSVLPFLLRMITIDRKAYDNLSAVNRILVSKSVVSSIVISQNLFKGIFCTAFSLC